MPKFPKIIFLLTYILASIQEGLMEDINMYDVDIMVDEVSKKPKINKPRISPRSQHCNQFGCLPKLTNNLITPSSLAEIDVQFWLYTEKHQSVPLIVSYTNLTAIFGTDFNPMLETKFIVHGFNNHCNSPTILLILNGLFYVSKAVNIFCVSWDKGAKTFNYPKAAENSQIVAQITIALLNLLNQRYGDLNNKTHFIGYSLGAHISGLVGRAEKNISRISGLDPAGPIFNKLDNYFKLDPSDAFFVDVIHSDGGSVKGLGTINPMGNLDFYPNGGKDQPGCIGIGLELVAVIGGDFTKFSCRHRRGPLLYAASMLTNCKFIGFDCPSYESFLRGECFAPHKEGLEMGYFAKKPKVNHQKIFLLTTEHWPHCGQQFLVTFKYSITANQDYWKHKSISIYFVWPAREEKFLLTTKIYHTESEVKIPIAVSQHVGDWHVEMLYVDTRTRFYKLDSITVISLTLTDVNGTIQEWKTQGNILYKNIRAKFFKV